MSSVVSRFFFYSSSCRCTWRVEYIEQDFPEGKLGSYLDWGSHRDYNTVFVKEIFGG